GPAPAKAAGADLDHAQGAFIRGVAHSLVAPLVMPLTMNRCSAMKMITIGRAIVVATAIMLFHSVPYWPTKLLSATVIGWMLSLRLSDSAKMNSPHAIRNENAATVISPGITSGSTTLRKAPNWVEPSSIEADSSSRGTVRKY